MPTEHKPHRITATSPIERQIRKAQEEGQFDDLPGAGKPLPDLDEVYDAAWWVKKLVRRERISMLPPALSIKLDIERALEKIRTLRSEEQVRAHVDALNAKISRVNAQTTTGPPTTTGRFDPNTIVDRWRSGTL